MKQFKVFKHPAGETQAVKQGWSWPAFFFNCIWALVKKQWALGFGFLIGYVVVLVVLAGIIGGAMGASGANNEAIMAVVSVVNNLLGLAIAFLFGVYGNSWREKNLLSRGFDFVDTVSAANPEGAIALYMKGSFR